MTLAQTPLDKAISPSLDTCTDTHFTQLETIMYTTVHAHLLYINVIYILLQTGYKCSTQYMYMYLLMQRYNAATLHSAISHRIEPLAHLVHHDLNHILRRSVPVHSSNGICWTESQRILERKQMSLTWSP